MGPRGVMVMPSVRDRIRPGTADEQVDRDDRRETRHTRGAVEDRQREEFGGINWGAAFFGWLTGGGRRGPADRAGQRRRRRSGSDGALLRRGREQRRDDRHSRRGTAPGRRPDRLFRRWLCRGAHVALRRGATGSRGLAVGDHRGRRARNSGRDRGQRVQPVRADQPAANPDRRGVADNGRRDLPGRDRPRHPARRCIGRQGRRALSPPGRPGRIRASGRRSIRRRGG